MPRRTGRMAGGVNEPRADLTLRRTHGAGGAPSHTRVRIGDAMSYLPLHADSHTAEANERQLVARALRWSSTLPQRLTQPVTLDTPAAHAVGHCMQQTPTPWPPCWRYWPFSCGAPPCLPGLIRSGGWFACARFRLGETRKPRSGHTACPPSRTFSLRRSGQMSPKRSSESSCDISTTSVSRSHRRHLVSSPTCYGRSRSTTQNTQRRLAASVARLIAA